MNLPKYSAIKDINFLIATQKAYSCSEVSRVHQNRQRKMPSLAYYIAH